MASKIYNIDSKIFIEYVKNSDTFTEILRKCGLENKGGNINTVKRRISKENIDSSHIKKGANHNLGKVYLKQRISKEEAFKTIFIENSKTFRETVKRLLQRYNLIEYKCSECSLQDKWNDKKLSLQLDHINGINNDNRLINLRYLCPNCHSQTANFAGKAHKKTYFCKKCNSSISKQSQVCFKCSAIQRRKTQRPTEEILKKEITELPITKIAQKYGVCDNTVRKWCLYYNIIIPYTRGYWQKKSANKI